jgi:hypothetical protein
MLAGLTIGCGGGGDGSSTLDPTTPATPETPTIPDRPLGTITVAALPAGSGVWSVAGVGADGRIYGTMSSVSGSTPRLVIWSGDYSAQPVIGPDSSRSSAARPNDTGAVPGDSGSRYGIWSTAGAGATTVTFSAANTGSFTQVMTGAVNDRGQVVGSGRDPAGKGQALFWATPGSAPIVLPSPQLVGILDFAAARAINANGDVAGWLVESRNAGTVTFQRAVLWKNTGTPAAPSWSPVLLDPTTQATATDVNDAGVVAGVRNLSDATIWVPGSSGYGRLPILTGESALPRVDRCGRSVGSVTSDAYVSHGGTATTLPLPAGVSATSVAAMGITTLTSGPFAGKGIIVGIAMPNLPLRWMIDGCP